MKTNPASQPQRATRSSTRGVQKPARATRAKSTPPPRRSTKPIAAAKKVQKQKVIPLALQEYHKQSALDPNGSSILFRHPREIFDNITNGLPAEALVCLSLTCKLALQYIGTSCWKLPDIRNRNLIDKWNLMQCLARDAPPHLSFCEYCNTLHPPLPPPRSHFQTKLTKVCMSQWALIDYFPQIRPWNGTPGYSLLHPHILEVFEAAGSNPTSTDLLSGSYTTTKHPKCDYILESSASWIHKNLILQHIHTFKPKSRNEILQLEDILSLPLQLCPHHSTTTNRPPPSRYLPTRAGNAPVLTHAIVTAFPPARRTGIPKPDAFRAPTPLEQKQMTAASGGEDVIWRCRGCTTKFHVLLEGENLVLRTWHCLGADKIHARNYYMWLVRREQANLGMEKRNSEFWYLSRTVPDFKIE